MRIVPEMSHLHLIVNLYSHPTCPNNVNENVVSDLKIFVSTVSCQKYSRKMADVLKRHISTDFYINFSMPIPIYFFNLRRSL